jgi:2-polyprenyl-6-methoxyphenol hydroxylase-like FAD-dependent oxidoreductase
MSSHYDVIIIGGRCAGSSLAIRLARQNLRILIVDRATFPSLPNIPSSPIIHAGTMRLMDELGIPEECYVYPDGKVTAYVMVIPGYFSAPIPTAQMEIDRNYAYGIDRNRFDTVLWTELHKYPTITACDNFTVTGILKDTDGRVTGISSKHGQYTADLVVGADGRFSTTAQHVGAKVVEEKNECTAAAYHAEWENVEPLSEEYPNTVTFYNTLNGFALIFIPINTRKYIISTYMQSGMAGFGPQAIESAYCKGLQSIPDAWKRLEKARQVTPVVGIRKIQNGYREAFGKGWALVGDALHYKDPIDGQGIYDALVETKILSECIALWKAGNLSWDEAGAQYQQQIYEATHTMFTQTVNRIKQEVFTPVPPLIVKTVLRWAMTDLHYQKQFLKYLARAIDPREYPKPNAGVILRGIWRDLRGVFAF